MSESDPDLVRYWFEFDLRAIAPECLGGVVYLDGGSIAYHFCERGVGVTGYHENDCLGLLASVIDPDPVPPLLSATRDVDVSTLDLDHRWVGRLPATL